MLLIMLVILLLFFSKVCMFIEHMYDAVMKFLKIFHQYPKVKVFLFNIVWCINQMIFPFLKTLGTNFILVSFIFQLVSQ